MTESTSIRQLTRDDIATCGDRFVSIARDVPGEYWREHHFLLDLPEKWHLSLAAWQGTDPVGYAILSRKSDGGAHLHHFMIAPNQRRSGLGGRLLTAAIEKCHHSGCSGMSLKVASQNVSAQRFYRQRGFSDVCEVGGYLTMRRNLVP